MYQLMLSYDGNYSNLPCDCVKSEHINLQSHACTSSILAPSEFCQLKVSLVDLIRDSANNQI